jgi:hypothetical protein
MRIRQVKPEFWRDHVMAEMTDTVRLVYIGLWMEADDAGFLRLDTTEIAVDLYPLTTRAVRERRVAAAMAVLVNAGRVEVEDCRKHATIPTLTEHQRFGGPEKRVLTISREHDQECIPAVPRGSPRFPASPRPVRNGKEREGKGNGGVQGGHDDVSDNDDEASDFRRLVPRPGTSATGVH